MNDAKNETKNGHAATNGSGAKVPSFAIITPSYTPHFEHCRLLAESVLRHVPEEVHHYILIDKSDQELFKVLKSPRTHLLLKQDILPWWLIQLPFARGRNWWINLKGLPVRGWILQQLAKLSVNQAVPADVYVYLDSGAFFVNDYDPRATMQNGKVPLFREQKEEVRVPWNTRWHQVSARLLGLPVESSYNTSYVGNLVYWKRENLDKMQAQIEKVTGSSWLVAVARQLRMSEYVLYGMFAEHVLGEASGQYFSTLDRSLNYWSEKKLDDAGLRELRTKLEPKDVIVMINEKAHIPVSEIRRVFVG